MKNVYKSLYPSIMSEFNIAPNTQIGRIEIHDKIYANENAYNIPEEKYSRGGEFIENLVTDNMIEYCHRWFHLSNIEQMIDDVDEFYGSKFNSGKFSNLVTAGYGNNNGVISAVIPTSSGYVDGVKFGQPKKITPVTFYTKRNPEYTYNNLYSTKGQ